MVGRSRIDRERVGSFARLGRGPGCGGVLAVAAVLLLGPGLARAAAAAGSIAFRDLGGGIAYASFEIPAGSGSPTAHAFRIDVSRAAVRVVAAGPDGARASVARLAAPFPRHVAVNGSFFDESGRALGAAIDRGHAVGGRMRSHWGALVVAGGVARIEPGALAPGDADALVQGMPRLVIDGQVPALKRQVAPRTAVCADGPTLTIVVATMAVDADALARVLAASPDAGGLGCRDALNLDGGSSSQLSVRLPGMSLEVSGASSVPNALVVVPGGEEAPAPAPAVTPGSAPAPSGSGL